MPKLALIDGSGFIFRAFHALPPLTTSKGMQTNAVYGFTRMVLSLVDNLKVDYLAVVFDAARKNFRNDIYSEYKANRPPPPEELIHQFALVREAVTALNIAALEKEGFEADDIIATYADLAEKQGFEVVIVSSDKDLMQLIKSPNIYMYDSVKKKYIKETEAMTKFGLPPDKIIYAQALIGDQVDNVPGVKGLGPKTAASLIEQYGTLAGIYNNIDKINKPAIKEKLLQNQTNAFISLELVTLKKDVPLMASLEGLRVNPINPYSLYNFCEKLEFKSLAINIAKKYNLEQSELRQNIKTLDEQNFAPDSIEELKQISIEKENKLTTPYTYKIVNHVQELEEVADKLKHVANIYCYFNGETLALVDDSFVVYLIIVNKKEQLLSLFSETVQPFSNISAIDLKKHIEPLLLNKGINKISYNLKKLLYFLNSFDIKDVEAYDDVHVMSYVLDGSLSAASLEEISKTHLLCNVAEIESQLAASLPDNELKVLLQETLCIKQLYNTFKRRLVFEGGKLIYEQADKPLIKVLYAMEQKGVLINPEVLVEIDKEITKELATLEQEIFKISGESFNLGSPKQIGEVLYNKLNIKGKKNKTGSWKTDAYFLEELDNQGIVIAGLILNWRKFSKLKNTYIDTLPSYIKAGDGRIHTTFLQTSTNTGRLSSLDPNLQNIPIKTDIGRKVRKAFVAKTGYKIISLDYSQIELRLLAHIAGVESLIEAFQNGEDIHRSTAKEIFGLENDEVTSEYRRKAKTINFGIIYGISEFGLARRLQLNKDEAKKYIETYFARYPEIRGYMEQAKEEARSKGYVLTEFGRKCYISGINSSNHALKSFAERAAINAKLQGSAADIMRFCMNKCFDFLKKSNLDADLILQIHDELVIEAKEDIANELAKNIANIMQDICSLKVSLVVNFAIGNNWLEAH